MSNWRGFSLLSLHAAALGLPNQAGVRLAIAYLCYALVAQASGFSGAVSLYHVAWGGEALDQAENLRAIAEVAIALAGFTGVVIVLGQRSAGSWSAAERSTIRVLLESSLGAVFFALFPAIIVSSFPAPITAWRLSAGLLTVYHLAAIVRADIVDRRGTAQFLGRKLDWGLTIGGLISSCATAVVALGFAAPAAALIYSLSLLYMLLVGALCFGALLLSGGRPAA